MLPCGIGICHYAFIYLFLYILNLLFLSIPLYFHVFKNGIDKSDESPRYMHTLALRAILERVMCGQLFLSLEKFVLDVCIFCSIFVSKLILWILKNSAASLFFFFFCGISWRWIDVYFQPV